MPSRPPRICTHPGCRTLTLSGRCDVHPYPREDNRIVKARQARRGLATNSAQWRRIRQQQLMQNPLCVMCLDAGRMTAASHVDHINGNSHDNQPGNLQSLCPSCHSRKTATEDGGFGNRGRGE